MVSNTWTRLSLEEMVVGSTALVLAFSVDVTFFPLLCSHETFTVLCISTLFGIMISLLKWEFGPLEAIFLTTFVGLSVDYTGTRRQKVEKALMHLSSAVLNGAMTTLAAPLFLLPCWI